MKRVLAAAIVLATIGLARATEPSASLEQRLTTVAKANAETAATGVEIAWSADGASGVIMFLGWSGGCRKFSATQRQPQPPTTLAGKACREGDGLVVSFSSDGKSRTRGVDFPPAPPPGPAPAPSREAGDTPDIDVKPVLVELPRLVERDNINGGHAVILLTAAPAARNLATCEAFGRYFDDSTLEAVRIGLQRRPDGGYDALRPVYWPIDERKSASSQTRCGRRLERYNFVRAQTIRDKLGLTSPGPHLVVARGDEQAAVTLDLSTLSNARIDEAVRFFRDGFSQETQAWNPEIYTASLRRERAQATAGTDVGAQLLAILAFVSRPGASVGAGCPRGDLSDCAR